MTKKSSYRAAVTGEIRSTSKNAASDEKAMHAAAMRFLKLRPKKKPEDLTPMQKRMLSGGT